MWLTILMTMLVVIPFSPAAAENEKIIEHETGFYYTVREGDTLWDLSRKFSDSAWLWPEMWQENSQIANPHRIYPGERIRLLRRTGAQKISAKKAGVAPPTLEDLIHYDYSSLDRVGFIRKKAAHKPEIERQTYEVPICWLADRDQLSSTGAGRRLALLETSH